MCLCGYMVANSTSWPGLPAGTIAAAQRRMKSVALVALLSTPALADPEPVRGDIVEIRHQRAPNRHTFLGWTADNRAVSHIAVCGMNDGGGWTCASKLEVVAGVHTTTTELLTPEYTKDSDALPFAVSSAVAAKAIRSERAALDALGPLNASATEVPVLSLTSDTCWVRLVAGKRTLGTIVKYDAKHCILDGGDDSVHDATLRQVHVSPDHKKLAAIVTVERKAMEWTSAEDFSIVVDVPAKE